MEVEEIGPKTQARIDLGHQVIQIAELMTVLSINIQLLHFLHLLVQVLEQQSASNQITKGMIL
jgi:hypothetical protein